MFGYSNYEKNSENGGIYLENPKGKRLVARGSIGAEHESRKKQITSRAQNKKKKNTYLPIHHYKKTYTNKWSTNDETNEKEGQNPWRKGPNNSRRITTGHGNRLGDSRKTRYKKQAGRKGIRLGIRRGGRLQSTGCTCAAGTVQMSAGKQDPGVNSKTQGD